MILFTFLFLSLSQVIGERILAVFPVPSKSHQNVHDAVILELAKRGHEIVMITAYPIENPPSNLKQIDVSFTKDEVKRNFNYEYAKGLRPNQFYERYIDTFLNIFEMILKMEEIKAILDDHSVKFDLLFISMVQVNCAFMHRFKGIPTIQITTMPFDYEYFGSPTHPILYPEFYRDVLYDLNIFQKIDVIYNYVFNRYIAWKFSSRSTKRLRKYFGDDMPNLLELKRNIDLHFISAYPLLFGIRPEVPAIIHIEGVHLKPKQPLPEDLESFLSSSQHGVIYMSFGTNVQSKDMTNETLQQFKDVFAELPYDVLWKFEDDSLPGLPDNVLIRKWFPQQDVLGHRNIKAFIFQGGQQSFEEAIQNCIPLICIPFVADQEANSHRIEKMQIGIRLQLSSLTKNNLKNAIINVTTEPMYKKKIEKLSVLFEDQPMTSKERAVWWTEYLLRHKGAKHIRSPAIDMSYIEFFMLDILAIFLGVLAVIIAVIASLIYLFCTRLRIKIISKQKKQ